MSQHSSDAETGPAHTAGRATSPRAGGLQEADSPKRRQILEGARKVLLQKGFEGSSMQDIARVAGVSKATLYVYFESKETMYEALVRYECSAFEDVVRRSVLGDDTMETELRNSAMNLIRKLLDKELLSSMRMVIGAGDQFPELARKVYEAGPSYSAQIMAEYFEMRVARGELAMEDCAQGAAIFLDMMFAELQRRALLMVPLPPEAELESFVAGRVALFLKLFRP